MSKLFDQAIGEDAHVVLESVEGGSLALKVQYPLTKLQAPTLAFLTKATAKVPFLQRFVPNLVAGLFSFLDVKPAIDVAEAEPTEGPSVVLDAEPVAAHDAAPVEPVHA